jgi:hypothetical protein
VELLKTEELDATISDSTVDITASHKAGTWLILENQLIYSKFDVDYS